MASKIINTAFALMAFTATALPHPASAYFTDGMEYDGTCTADGYVLTSKYPVTRVTGVGAASQPVTGHEKLYLGKSCDAFNKIFGKGKWCWANGGFLVEFPEQSFGFGRQELRCEPAQSFEDKGDCGC